MDAHEQQHRIRNWQAVIRRVERIVKKATCSGVLTAVCLRDKWRWQYLHHALLAESTGSQYNVCMVTWVRLRASGSMHHKSESPDSSPGQTRLIKPTIPLGSVNRYHHCAGKVMQRLWLPEHFQMLTANTKLNVMPYPAGMCKKNMALNVADARRK